MAINYTNVFGVIGKYISAINDIDGYRNRVNDGTLRDPIMDKLQASGHQDLMNDDTFLLSGASYNSQIQIILNDLSRVLVHPDFLLPDLPNNTDTTVQGVLAALVNQMNDDSETVLEKDTPILTVTAPAESSHNSSVGGLFMATAMSGNIPPHPGLRAHPAYGNVQSEFNEDASVRFTCTSDGESGGVEGRETWQVNGAEMTERTVNNDRYEGTYQWGAGPIMTTAQGINILTNGNLNSWFGIPATPQNWVVDSGTAGVDFIQETLTANVYRGSASLKAVSGQDFQISQHLSAGIIPRNEMLSIYTQFKAAGTLSTGSVVVRVKDDTTTFGTLTYDSSVDSTSWGNQRLSLYIPKDLSGDTLFIELESSSTDTDVYVDDIILCPFTYFGGQGYMITAGQEPWIRGDRLLANPTGVSLTLDSFNTFFTRYYGVQLPSASSGSETIPDTLITA